MSIRPIKATDGRIIWFQVDVGKLNGRRIRKRFTVGKSKIVDPLVRRARGIKSSSTDEEHALAAAKLWEEKQRDQIVKSRQSVIAIPIDKIPQAKVALDLLDGYEETLDQVVREWMRFKYVTGLAEPWTFRQAVDACLANKRNLGVTEAHLGPLEVKLLRIAETFGDQPCDRITTEELEEYAAKRAKTPHTWRNYRRDLGIVFNFAISRHRATRNPAKNMPKPQFSDAAPVILSLRDIAAFLKNCGEDLLPYIALGLFAGIRPFEITRITSQDIDLETKTLHVLGKRSRSRSRRHVKIAKNLAEWLTGWKPEGRTYWNIRDMIQAASVDSKVKLAPDVFRHSFCSYHLALHRNPGMTAHEAGHRDQEMLYRHYRDVVDQKAAREYFSITPATLPQFIERHVTKTEPSCP